MQVLGVDPAFNAFALVLAEVPRSGRIHIKRFGLIRTVGDGTDLERARIICQQYHDMCAEADIVVAEIPYGSRNARACWTLGISLGIVASTHLPIIPASAVDIRDALKFNSYSKKTALRWATRRYPQAPWYRDGSGNPFAYNHHLADALMAVEYAQMTGVLWRN